MPQVVPGIFKIATPKANPIRVSLKPPAHDVDQSRVLWQHKSTDYFMSRQNETGCGATTAFLPGKTSVVVAPWLSQEHACLMDIGACTPCHAEFIV